MRATRRRSELAAVWAVLFALVGFVLVGASAALAQTPPAQTPEEEARRIGKRLQCPVCQGASVAESPSELATQMRAVIQRKVEQGESEEEIVRYFVERYGDAVLVEPPRRGLGLAVWLAPIVVLVTGAGILAVVLRGWLRRRATSAATAPPLLATAAPNGAATAETARDARIRAELERFRRES
jgi:cytochrome c-type biogenesis protein CcmH